MNTFQILEKLFRWTENFLDFLKVTFLSGLGKLFRQTFRQTRIPRITSFLLKFCTKQSYQATHIHCKAVQKHNCTMQTLKRPSRIQDKALSQIKQCSLIEFRDFRISTRKTFQKNRKMTVFVDFRKLFSFGENFLLFEKTFQIRRKLFRFFKTDTLKSFPSTLYVLFMCQP